MIQVLECSSKGDSRFSALYAKVEVGGKVDTIENHYQLSKRFNGVAPKDWKEAKGKEPTTIVIGKVEISGKYLSAWYDMLWVKYLDAHPELVEFASQYDDFSDMFAGKSLNSQANSIRAYIKEGRESILNRADVRLFRFELVNGGLAGRTYKSPNQLIHEARPKRKE